MSTNADIPNFYSVPNWEYWGRKYHVQRIVHMKNPVTREWVQAVLYRDWALKNFYVREVQDFLAKFKPVEESEVSDDDW